MVKIRRRGMSVEGDQVIREGFRQGVFGLKGLRRLGREGLREAWRRREEGMLG